MAILDLLTFDSLSEDQSVTTGALAGDAWSTYSPGASPVAKATSGLHGGRGVSIVEAADLAQITYSGEPTIEDRVHSFYFRIDLDPGANTYLASALDYEGSTTRADWRINPDRTVTIRDGFVATGGGASPEVLAVDVWYRAEWLLTTSGQELRIYVGESISPYLVRIGSLSSNLHSRMLCGVISTPNGHSLSVDTVRIADDWTGPYGTPEEPLATPENFTFEAHPGPSVVEIEASWDAVAGASSYALEVEELAGGIWSEMATFVQAGTSITLDDVDPGTNYRGRVRALPTAV